MINWIEHVSEPKHLILAWQAPDHLKKRFRWAVGKLSRSQNEVIFRYFCDGEEFQKYNPGQNYKELLSLGYQGYPAFDLRVEVHKKGVLEAFMRRTPPRTRSDFREYLKGFRLSSSRNISDWALLAITEAKLPGDGFSVIDTLDSNVQYCDLYLELAGYRYYAKDADFARCVGDPVELFAEPTNAQDKNAVAVRCHHTVMGYINRLQTIAFQCWLREERVTAVLEKVNGSSDRPRAFIFVRVRPPK